MILDKDNMFFNILQVYIKFYKKGNFFSMLVFINVRDRKWRTENMSIAWTRSQTATMGHDFYRAAIFGGASTINNLFGPYPMYSVGSCHGIFGGTLGGYDIGFVMPRTLEAYDRYSAVNILVKYDTCIILLAKISAKIKSYGYAWYGHFISRCVVTNGTCRPEFGRRLIK